MSADADILPTGRSKGWIAAVLLLFAAQVLALHYFSRGSPLSTGAADRFSIVYSPAEPVRGDNDAALLLLPSLEGFSDGWMKIQPLRYAFQEWPERAGWLAPRFEPASREWAGLQPPARRANGILVQKPLMEPVLAARASAPRESTILIEGEIAGRRLVSSEPLPRWKSSDVIPATVVEVLVSRNGHVFSATLSAQGSSGLPDADSAALDLAARMVFERAPEAASGPSLVPGRIVFQWQADPAEGQK